jgi:hypothetical protein
VGRALAFATLLLVAGCPADDDMPSDPDGGGGELDAPAIPGNGLTIQWSTSPTVPGDVTTQVDVTKLVVEYSSLRVIGDAAPSGDPRTSRGKLKLEWEGAEAPAAVELGGAPAGMYSRLDLGVGGENERFELRGTAMVRGARLPFRLRDSGNHPRNLAIAVEVESGRGQRLRVGIDVAAVVAAVPFDELESDDEELTLDEGDPQYAAIWAALGPALRIE